MHIVLYQPEIPQNTGNIARTCAATGTTLHLVEPLGFSLSDKYLKRAGLDYWYLLDVKVHKDYSSLLSAIPDARTYYASTKAKQDYAHVTYRPDDILIFGPETRGLPEKLLAEKYDSTIRIPMLKDARSLNLSNAVAVVLYEALRQLGFPELQKNGILKQGSEQNADG
jgi:tRNA (cytidine/uridine-2'-O-)-methyltransferase